MLNQAKATPRPWRYEEGTKTIRSVPSNYWLATMNSFDGAVDNDANASLIVKAVNNHDDALEAIRQGIAYLEAIKQGKKVDIQYVQGKMREVLFNASSNEYRSINWEV
jgi:hypothetical protein